MDIKNTLESLKTALQTQLPDISVKIYSRDVAQYSFISQKPVLLITLGAVDFSEPPHSSIKAQKASIELAFHFYSRTACDTTIRDLSDVIGAIQAQQGISYSHLRPLSHIKDVCVFELKATLDGILD